MHRRQCGPYPHRLGSVSLKGLDSTTSNQSIILQLGLHGAVHHDIDQEGALATERDLHRLIQILRAGGCRSRCSQAFGDTQQEPIGTPETLLIHAPIDPQFCCEALLY
jgi:hypothetical protein